MNARAMVTATRPCVLVPSISWASLLRPYGLAGMSACSSVSASFVMLFVVYGTFMDVAGAGGFWLDLSLATMGRK